MKLNNPEVRIENTNRCNAKCIICPRDKMTRPKTTMPFKLYDNIVSQAIRLGAKQFSIFGYGEPLIDTGIAKKLSLCREYDTFITTNASLLTTDTAKKLLDANLNRIRFSAHGTFDNYEKVHKDLRFDDVARNIFNFIKVNEVQYNNSCAVDITVIPMNGEDTSYIKSFWKGLNLEIWKPHNWVYGREYRKSTPEKVTCGRPFNGPLQINADGKVIVCCFDYNAEMVVGDVTKQSLEKILKGRRFNNIRAAHNSHNKQGLICEKCDQLYINDNPLLYSSFDDSIKVGVTSSFKFKLKEN